MDRFKPENLKNLRKNMDIKIMYDTGSHESSEDKVYALPVQAVEVMSPKARRKMEKEHDLALYE